MRFDILGRNAINECQLQGAFILFSSAFSQVAVFGHLACFGGQGCEVSNG